VQQRADFGAEHGLNRATLDAQKVREINDFAISGLLATDQKVRSSNLFGRAILSLHLLNFPSVVSSSASRQPRELEGWHVALREELQVDTGACTSR
jgi:hypothetical protein